MNNTYLQMLSARDALQDLVFPFSVFPEHFPCFRNVPPSVIDVGRGDGNVDLTRGRGALPRQLCDGARLRPVLSVSFFSPGFYLRFISRMLKFFAACMANQKGESSVFPPSLTPHFHHATDPPTRSGTSKEGRPEP